MDRPFPLDDGPLGAALISILLQALLDHHQALDNDPVFLPLDLEDLSALAAFLTRDDHHQIPFFYVKILHTQITSGASEIIFMNFLSRNSRATGPKMRVPRRLLSLSMMTIALVSKRRYDPSLRRIGWRVRTTTASTTSPFFTVPSGAASLMWALMMSPTCA